MFEVTVTARELGPFAELVGTDRVEALARRAAEVTKLLRGRTVWNVNSTAVGGGVAEILRSLLRYASALGVDTRWLVLEGPPPFFALTKRLHNALHDMPGDGSALGPDRRALYERVSRENAEKLLGFVRSGDVVVCHDPQTAGLVPHLMRARALVVWRCHIGHDRPGVYVDEGWRFLRRYVERVSLAVFSRASFAPSWMARSRTTVLPPNIDPFSTKNQWLSEVACAAILRAADVVAPPTTEADLAAAGPPSFARDDGSVGRVARRAAVLRTGGPIPWDAPLVLQVSRWDRMKDHIGVLRAFTELVQTGRAPGAVLALVGPEVTGVADDPEGPEVFLEIERAFRALPEPVRARVHIAQLPMGDTDENAIVVNALQRHAAVIVQKSLREGFGLTVTEAMWKCRPIVASAVGGIQDQIRDGREGLLVARPTDVHEAAEAIARILSDEAFGARLAHAAHARATSDYLSVSALENWARVVERLTAPRTTLVAAAPPPSSP